jgi:hypothetical protein
MRKTGIYAGLAALAIAVPAAQANDQHPNNGKKGNPPGQAKEHKGQTENNGKHKGATPTPAQCAKLRHVGYNARGTFVSSTLTQTKGQDTAKKGDDRYSGTVTVNVTRANHKALKGEQTFTLTNGRVFFADADHNKVADVPEAGDRVVLHGKITKLRHGCDATGFTPEITVRHVHFKAPKPPKTESKKKS